jgi:hypothetical protein
MEIWLGLYLMTTSSAWVKIQDSRPGPNFRLNSPWLAKIHLINPRLLEEKCTPIIIHYAGGAPRASPPYLLAGKPLAPLSFADSLRERRDLVARHPDHKRSGLKPRLSAVGVKPFICCLKER